MSVATPESSAAVQINTKKVSGRREVHYESMQEFLEDAERLALADVRTLGNWSQGQIYAHMARSLDASIARQSSDSSQKIAEPCILRLETSVVQVGIHSISGMPSYI